jgi:hypothetical protein
MFRLFTRCPRPALSATLRLEALDERAVPAGLSGNIPTQLGQLAAPGLHTGLTPRQGHVMGYDSLGTQSGTNEIWVSFILQAGNSAANGHTVSDGPMPQRIGSFFDIFTEDW